MLVKSQEEERDRERERERHTHTHIYIYTYIHTYIHKRSKFQFFPNFRAKNDPPPKKNTHTHLVWGFFTFQCFVFFLIFAFSCLSFSSFPLLLDFFKPKSGPSNEVIGYMAITSISGPKKKVKISIFPKFYSKNDPEKTPHLVWGFFTFQCFVFFLIFAFSCFSFSSFPLLLDFLKPKNGPSNEVIGYMAITSISGPKKGQNFNFSQVL